MMKNFVAILSICALLQMAACRPTASDDFTKDIRIELPGSERISKRSVEVPTPSEDDILTPPGGSSVLEPKALESNEEFDETVAFHPIPVFKKRSLNERTISKPVEDIQKIDNDDKSDKDMTIAATGLVFLPMARSRNGLVRNQRSRRSAQDADKMQLSSKPVEDNQKIYNDDDMNIAETGLVFLPMVRSRNGLLRNQRFRRSAQDADKTQLPLNGAATDDLEGAETIIFRPVFRSQLRPVRSILEKDLQGDEMVIAENGLIFRPVFRTKQRGVGTV